MITLFVDRSHSRHFPIVFSLGRLCVLEFSNYFHSFCYRMLCSYTIKYSLSIVHLFNCHAHILVSIMFFFCIKQTQCNVNEMKTKPKCRKKTTIQLCIFWWMNKRLSRRSQLWLKESIFWTISIQNWRVINGILRVSLMFCLTMAADYVSESRRKLTSNENLVSNFNAAKYILQQCIKPLRLSI